ncbi:SDR family oxidoreductase [Acidomonas methanolica]|uniref:Oxidoreductase/short-chain dehydrogenase/reductase SDR n=1 Tax=Acidomonas methanolica NBRC 104435 TaxID=1231351 RepID=A0A023D962_ACIMT|nr:SDR family oxidoreductase [Acidomonas methanolica]MBU2655770.1 SDR family oxidoreductase [Acidomonas methanolica]TCS19050.1 NAD(P)-dependent dehydrogenase (short-subunit alcohol dehydrogenase family) [Acidomonas methanolica]GAJ30687.1 oxidoreductase/short-chain dehydrogenase/reductase SDR [Acidomonas methanolica NBRC 104435]GBQ50741.1 short-chain dehydrogenase/reductase SDR [Acidomonas methanolica]GEL00732.1 short-chain dehydrogenase [Acidomonas methanolica NBRC 104435]
MRLSGKTALITGGTSGIGLATAKLFVKEGARVAVTGRDESRFADVQAELGDEALVLSADVRSIDAMQAVSARIQQAFGGLDILFANAGYVIATPLPAIDVRQYDDVMDVSVKGVVFTMQAALPVLREGASVILTTSFIDQTGKHGLSLVAAAKAAARSLARSWSYELLDRKIRVNAVAPGGIETPLLGKLGLSEAEVEDFKTQFASTVPLGRMGRPEEIAAAVLYLASDESRYVVGTELVVDGGCSQL